MSDPLVHVGYFPKKIVATPEFLKAPQVIAVRSVSNCISPGPENWITQWKHNDLGLYDTIAAAVDVIPEGARPDYELHAYRILPTQWDEGRALPFEIPTLNPEPIPSDFIPLGFDVVSMEYSMFSCSPLSCNYMAAEIMTNQHCLLDDLETAKRIALQFSSGKVEPGPYLVVEVLARMKSAPHLLGQVPPLPITHLDLCFLTSTPIPDLLAHLASLHIPVELGPVPRTGASSPITSIYLRDPDGNLLELANPTPPQQFP